LAGLKNRLSFFKKMYDNNVLLNINVKLCDKQRAHSHFHDLVQRINEINEKCGATLDYFKKVSGIVRKIATLIRSLF